MKAIEAPTSVLCDPEGKCCISGSDDDRRLIDSALEELAQAAQAAPAAVTGTHVTDDMALAFHSALSDGAIGSDEVEDIKTGLRAALADAPTAQQAPRQEAESAGWDADRIVKWSDRIQRAHPKSEPEFWPDALRVKYMADEISDLRAALAAADSVTAPAGDPMDWPLPCDITAGGVTIGKGRPLRTVQTRLEVQAETNRLLLKRMGREMESAPPPTQEADSVTAPAGGALRAQVETLTRDCGRQASKIAELIADLKFQEGRHREDRARLQALYEHQRGECWYWQGDGQDHLESLCNTLPVVIRADQLRALVSTPHAQTADSVLEDAARYRWLREWSSTMFVKISINGDGAEIAETLDSAVDAARKQGANHD